MATKVQSPAGQAATAAAPVATLTNEEILRYSRHLIMPEVGMDGQLKLKNAKVLLIGTGGLGAPLGLYLAAAGVCRKKRFRGSFRSDRRRSARWSDRAVFRASQTSVH